MSDDDDIDGLAAEYVLGTLVPSEREAVDRRRASEPALDAAIRAWEVRLAPLAEHAPQIIPPAHLYPRILARIGGSDRALGRRSPPRARRAIVSGLAALAASLLLVLGWLLLSGPGEPGVLTAQLHRVGGGADLADESTLAAFSVSLDVSSGMLSIKPGSVKPVAGRSYRLGLLPKDGTRPIALGTISPFKETTLPWPAAVPVSDLADAWLVVGLEPDTAAPPPGPAPVVFKGRLSPGKPR